MVVLVMMVVMTVMVAVVITYCCITSYPQNFMAQNNPHLLSHVSVGQGSRHSLAGCLWLNVSYMVANKVSARGVNSPVISTGGGSASKLTYTVVGRT